MKDPRVNDITPEKLAELREFAQKVAHRDWPGQLDAIDIMGSADEGVLLSCISPSTILALLDHIEQLTARAEAAEAKLREAEQQAELVETTASEAFEAGLAVGRFVRHTPAAVSVPEVLRKLMHAYRASEDEQHIECRSVLSDAIDMLAANKENSNV